MSLLLVGYAFGLPAFLPGLGAFVPPIETIEDLWAGIDPRALPLEIEVIKSWDEGDVHLEMLYFTGRFSKAKNTDFWIPWSAQNSLQKVAGGFAYSWRGDKPQIWNGPVSGLNGDSSV